MEVDSQHRREIEPSEHSWEREKVTSPPARTPPRAWAHVEYTAGLVQFFEHSKNLRCAENYLAKPRQNWTSGRRPVFLHRINGTVRGNDESWRVITCYRYEFVPLNRAGPPYLCCVLGNRRQPEIIAPLEIERFRASRNDFRRRTRA